MFKQKKHKMSKIRTFANRNASASKTRSIKKRITRNQMQVTGFL